MFQQSDVQLLHENAATPASQRIANAIARRHRLKTYDGVHNATPLAIHAARSGDAEAMEWLSVCAPTLAERLQAKPRGDYGDDDGHLVNGMIVAGIW